jgi:hypothetical protein
MLGVVWLLRRTPLRFRMDGVIFGAAAGMGFAAIEIGLYALARVETVGVPLGMLWFRALLSPFTHGTWTAMVCATIWRERVWNFGWLVLVGVASILTLRAVLQRAAQEEVRQLQRGSAGGPNRNTVTHLSRYCYSRTLSVRG